MDGMGDGWVDKVNERWSGGAWEMRRAGTYGVRACVRYHHGKYRIEA